MKLKMCNFGLFFLLVCLNITIANAGDGLERHLIACHTTDFVCFKRQYKVLRDKVLLANKYLNLTYEPPTFQYGDTGTCVRISGWEKSSLIGIRMNSVKNELSLLWDLPLKIEQIKNKLGTRCVKPSHDLGVIEPFRGELHKFSGNASIEIIYPYELRTKKDKHYLVLLEEDIDMVLDVPDLSDDFEFNLREFEDSEWAYGAVQNWDAAAYLVAPFSERYKAFAGQVPLESYLLLYPEEKYENLHFSYDDDAYKTHCANLFYGSN